MNTSYLIYKLNNFYFLLPVWIVKLLLVVIASCEFTFSVKVKTFYFPTFKLAFRMNNAVLTDISSPCQKPMLKSHFLSEKKANPSSHFIPSCPSRNTNFVLKLSFLRSTGYKIPENRQISDTQKLPSIENIKLALINLTVFVFKYSEPVLPRIYRELPIISFEKGKSSIGQNWCKSFSNVPYTHW